MRLVVTPVTIGRTAKTQVEKQDGNGNTVAVFVGLFADQNEIGKAARRLGVAYDLLLDFIWNKYRKQGVNTLDLQTTRTAVVFNVRAERSGDATPYAAFNAALHAAMQLDNAVIEWGSTETYCCLDIDFHGHAAPTHDLLMHAETVCPAPLWYWASRGGGLHCIYEGHGVYTAAELAAVAALSFAMRFPLASFEFLHRTRHPPADAEIHTRVADTDTGFVRKLLGDYTAGDAADWLAANGYAVGGRYPHTQCPLNPKPAAEGNSGPVMVHEDHIHCFVCAKSVSFAALCGDRIDTAVAACVKNLVHWGHARYIVERAVQQRGLAERVYRALLKLRYGDDPRIPAVFAASKDFGLLRYDGYWCDSSGTVLKLDNGSAILKALPCAQYIDADGEIAVDAERVNWLAQTTDLTPYGYIPLHPVRGIQLTQQQELPPNRVYTVLHSRDLSAEHLASKRPRYVDAAQRMPLDDAWATLETVFPGLDRKLIELLIVGRGCTEHRTGLPPMLFLTGPTGAGKTAHVHIAAAIIGDCVSEPTFTQNHERLRQAVMDGKRTCGVVLFNEVFKNAKIDKAGETEAMETLLSFTPDSTSHALYIGSVRMGDLPLLVWTDNRLPLAVQQHEQIGRRMIQHTLARSVSWEQPLADAGIGEPKNLRANGTPAHIAACDAIVSHIIDTHFPLNTSGTDFAQVAALLGFKRLRECDAVQEKYNLIRDLYAAVCAAPDADATTQHRHGRGSKRYVLDPADSIYAALDACWDDDEKHKATCRVLDEADLAQVLGLRCPARYELKQHGKTRVIRFVSHDGGYVNVELQAV